MGARDISTSELRQNLADVLKRVKRGETLQITQHGTVVARIEPARTEQAAAAARIEALRKTVVLGDVLTPIDVRWSAAHGELLPSDRKPKRTTRRRPAGR